MLNWQKNIIDNYIEDFENYINNSNIVFDENSYFEDKQMLLNEIR